jgi:hypothetical protein
MSFVAAALLTIFAAVTSAAEAAEVEITQIPDEYESNSAFSASMNNAGYAANDPHSAIRANPALLGTQKAYSVAAGYHWPVEGRDYFQASVVDTKTSKVAAGVSYTGFMDEYRYNDKDNPDVSRFDSPLEKRGVIAMAHPVGAGMVGVGATWVKSRPLYSSDERRAGQSVQGTGLNLGAVYPITPQLIFGAATENVSNSKIRNYAPKTHKTGVAYTSGAFAGMLDFRQRERVQEFEGEQVSLGAAPASQAEEESERMAIATVTAKMQNYLKITGSYGHSLSDERKQLGGGISLESQGFALSYTANRPYLAKSSAHQSIALVLDIAM